MGIGEGIAALAGGGDLLAGLFGGGEAAAAGAGAAEGAGAAFGADAAGAALGADAAGATALGADAAGAGALGAGGADALAAGTLGDLAAAGGGGADAFAGGFGTAGAATGNLGAAIPDVLAAPAGGGGLGAAGFAPAPGVELAGGIAPDATSAAAFSDQAVPLASRFGDVSSAISSGAFDPQGANFTTFQGGGAPTGGAGSDILGGGPGGAGANSPLPVQQVPTQSFTQGTGGLDQSIINAQTGAGPATSLQPPGAMVPGGAPAAAASPTGTGGGSFLDSLKGSLTKNAGGLALGAAGLGYNILQGQQQSAAVKALQAQASKQNQTADTLSGYLTSGTLPPGLQASVDQATQSAKATAISNAAGQGLPTDPAQNTALAERLAQIDQQGPIVAAQIAQQLLSSGATYAGLSDQLYTQLAQIDQQQTTNIGKAIANMASALNTGGTKIQIGGTSA